MVPDCSGDNWEYYVDRVDDHEECLERKEGEPMTLCFLPVIRESGLQLIGEQCGDRVDNNKDGQIDEGCIEIPENHPPVAKAGPDQTVISGKVDTLNGNPDHQNVKRPNKFETPGPETDIHGNVLTQHNPFLVQYLLRHGVNQKKISFLTFSKHYRKLDSTSQALKKGLDDLEDNQELGIMQIMTRSNE